MIHIADSEKRWRQLRREYPLLAEQLDAIAITGEEYVLLKIVYAGLDVHDIPSVDPDTVLEYVRGSIQMRACIPYARTVPEELFYCYVLPPRINNEFLDGSRGWLFEQLRHRVRGKSMLDAALEVNYWCYEHATYLPTDDRTIGPRGMCRRARGRCGEESTLLTAALRAVGIPARQVYVPLWAHCDDNHAWVEFWAEGKWHHMGACEPAPVPDTGWFDSAASRAMLVRSRVPDFTCVTGYKIVNTTARYAPVAKLKVTVQKDGRPAVNVQVRFQIINESRLSSIHTENTDAQGCVFFETGLGCLILSVYLDGRLIEKAVDLRTTTEAVLHWEEGVDPLTQEWEEVWELVPPEEKIPSFFEADMAHQQRLRDCDRIRSAYEETFASEDTKWLARARGNYAEIDKFLHMDTYPLEDREMLLSVLAEKDFGDVTCDVLEDFLAASLPWKDKFPVEIWKDKILAPRVENEMLQPVRSGLGKFFENIPMQSVDDVYFWMEANIRIAPEYGLTDRRGNPLGYVRHGVCPESEWDILAVQICRAVGIPASLHQKPKEAVKLTLRCDEQLLPGENWSISRWEAGEYRKVALTCNDDMLLSPGSYSLITARRQIDGTVNASAKRFVLTESREITASIQPDQTASKLKSVSIPSIAGAAKVKRHSLLVFLEPGAEPTEHLLQELLELKEDYACGGWPLQFLVRSQELVENETFQRVLIELAGCTWGIFQPFDHYCVQTAMGIGDSRLPLAVVLDAEGQGVYGCANYNIRSAHTMLRILRMITSGNQQSE